MSLIGQIVTSALSLVGALTQGQTNGASKWGTINPQPTFPNFLTNNPLGAGGFPWGSLTAGGNNPYKSAPFTGVTRRYDFTIARGQIAPDGYQKDVILINGQFPGPPIEANWGDTISVTVRNQISGPEEGTAMHWHGFLQTDTPYYDGTPGVQQCPIAPGSTFTYTFKAELYGSTWYHSHYSSQVAGGLFGPLIVHGPKNSAWDVDLGPVMLADWFHTEYFKIVQSVMGPGGNPRPASDNNLINGKNNFDCSTKAPGDNAPCTSNAGLAKFKFTQGKTHLLRLINTGADALQRFSIDGHNMTVVSNDFVPITPYTTNVVTLGVGQRADVLVKASYKSGSAFWMRANISTPCSATKNPNALAAIYYDGADTSKAPKSTAWNVPDPATCANDDLSKTVPTYKIPAKTPTTTVNLDIGFFVNETKSFLWTLGGTSMRANLNQPILPLAQAGNFSYPKEWNVINFKDNDVIRVVVNNPTPASHPMHLHGHNMQILSEGPGNWDGSTIINPSNPQRRDVQMVRANGHYVFQYESDNPGVWPFHCHIAWHISGGLYASLLEKPSKISEKQIPMVIKQTCDDWNAYTKKTAPLVIDSGV
ncbi:hypothetical protein HYALB_00000405 [Hymenoscyphus albidus]|uniref:laccase n=1 Tax=Hymenoscyphus albidus TaxID=595503 RepID=A0A9N9LJD3_9HELO|nr:hypothetical protein HYALB_00000405 [Hymenoscyphus albidus]